MKSLLILVWLVGIAFIGTAYAQDLPAAKDQKPAATYAQIESNADVTEQEAAGTEDKAGADVSKPKEKEKIEKPRNHYGLMFGLYYPSGSEVKNVFGDYSVRYGLRSLPVRVPQSWRFGFDVGYYAMSDRDNDAKLIPLTAGVFRWFGEGKKMRTYVAANAGPCYCDVNAPDIAVNKSGWEFNANATCGLLYRNRYGIEARYDYISEFAGLDFSSLTVSAVAKLFSARF